MSQTPHDPTPTWIAVAALDSLWEGAPLAVPVAGRELALYRVGEAVYATDNLCSHGNARLCDGFIEGHEIECPLHQARFDVRDGAPRCGPATQPLRCHAVKLVDGQVFVAAPPPA